MREDGAVSKTDPIRVLIVDDHQIVRTGLRTFLELQDDIAVVGEAADGLAAVDLAARLEPDVVLMDIVMPKLDGIAATRKIRELQRTSASSPSPASSATSRSCRPSRPAPPATF